MPIINPFVIIEISLANLIFEVLIQKDFCTNEVSEASLNEYKRIKHLQQIFGKLPIMVELQKSTTSSTVLKCNTELQSSY